MLLLSGLPADALAEVGSSSKIDTEQRQELSEAEVAAERWGAVQVCFRCHDMSEAIISQQPRRRQKKHRKAMAKQRSCLDCHTSDEVACCHDRMFPKINRWE